MVFTNKQFSSTWVEVFVFDRFNEMNGVLGHLCAHIGSTGAGEPPERLKMVRCMYIAM